MRHLILVVCLLLLATSTFAQSTTVTLSVTDAGGQSWNNGTYSFKLTPAPQYPNLNTYQWTGGALSLTISGSVNSSGGASVSIPSNTAISPVGSTWVVQVCPQATADCFNSAATVIQNATQTVTLTPPAIAINLNNTAGARAYVDAEIISAPLGGQYYNLTSNVVKTCIAVTGSACTSWATGGGGGSGVSSFNTRTGAITTVSGDIPNNAANTTGTAANLSGTPALPNGTTATTQSAADNSPKLATTAYADAAATAATISPTVINVSATPYNIKPGWQLQECSTTSGQPTVTCTNFNFTSSHVGWLAHYTNCTVAGPCVGNTYTFPLNSGVENTIISVSGHVATLSQNASASVTNGLFTFGPNNETGWTALETALSTLGTTPNCPALLFGPGFTMTKTGHFNSITCKINNLTASDSQLTVMGFSQGNTFLEPTQDFDFTTCTGGVSSNTCFGGAMGIHWVNMGIDGGGASLTGTTHNVNILEMRIDTLITGFYCTDWGSSATGMVGLIGNAGNQPSYSIQWLGCGSKPLYCRQSCGITHSFFQQTTTTPVVTVDSGAEFDSKFNGMGPASQGAFNCSQLSNPTQWSIAGTMISDNDVMTNCGGTNNNGIVVTGTFRGSNTKIQVAGTASSSGIVASGTALVTCANCLIQGAGAGIGLFNSATFQSLGGNNINGGVAAIGINAATTKAYISPTDTITGTNQASIVAGSIALTSGWGTSTVGTVSSYNAGRRSRWTITAAGVPGAGPVVTVTFPTTLFVAPACTLQEVAGTFGVITNPAIVTTTTTATITFSGTPVAAQTYTFVLDCNDSPS